MSEAERRKRKIERLVSQWDQGVQYAIALTRRQKGLSQKVVAERMGWTIDIISNVEKGRREISVAEFIVLAEQIGVSPETLFKRIAKL